MSSDLTPSDLSVLLRETAIVASQFARQMDLSSHEREDVRQDLLADLFARLKDFDPSRGCLAAFATMVTRHHLTYLARRYQRNRTLFAPRSLDEPVAGDDGATLAALFANEDGYLAFMGAAVNPIPAFEDRLSLDQTLGTLSTEHISLLADLIADSSQRSSYAGKSRATRYRQLGEVRLRLVAAGLSAQR